MRNWNHFLERKIADGFPELSGSDLNTKTSLVFKHDKTIIELGYHKIL